MFGSKFFSARYWQARLFTRTAEAPPPSGPTGGGSLWWRETLPPQLRPEADAPAEAAADAVLAARNAEALILLLT